MYLLQKKDLKIIIPCYLAIRKRGLNNTQQQNNSGLNAKTKVSEYKKGLCLTEKLVHKNPLLFLYVTVRLHSKCTKTV